MNHRIGLLKKAPLILIGTGSVCLLVFFLGSSMSSSSKKPGRNTASSVSNHWSLSHFVDTYAHAWVSMQDKVDALRKSEEENAKLRLENASLKLGLESVRFECHAQAEAKTTKNYEIKLNQETGAKVGRTLASMSYRPPTGLIPSQLYTLGVSYFKSREDEKAAVIFTSLAGLEDTDIYRNPKNLMLTGMAWYRLENFALADNYFDEVLKRPENAESIEYQAQARLWKALVSKRLNKDIKSQYWLRELLDHHPHAPEAKWINSAEAQSEGASEAHH